MADERTVVSMITLRPRDIAATAAWWVQGPLWIALAPAVTFLFLRGFRFEHR